MKSQICCSQKLILALGLKPGTLPYQEQGLPPLSTWYADIFTFNHRKCVAFYNPSTGYGFVAAYLVKKQLQNLNQQFLRTYQAAMTTDGVSATRMEELLGTMAEPNLCRTTDRKARGHLVQAVKDCAWSLPHADVTDPKSVERQGHLTLGHGVGGPFMAPLETFSKYVGEELMSRVVILDRHRDICEILVTLEGVEPPIYRRILVPSLLTLDRVHRVIQGAFGWTNSHLHIFLAGTRKFEAIYEKVEEYEGEDEQFMDLAELLEMGAGSAEYIYDFGDEWRHTIRLEKRYVSDEMTGPTCMDGSRSGPPEDAGGPDGYEQMLKLFAKPANRNYKSLMNWLPEGFDPEEFSVESANQRIYDMLRPHVDNLITFA